MVDKLWLGLSVALALPSIFIGDLTHFTWWGVVQWYGFSLLRAFGHGERYIITFVSQALITIFGVIVMSAMGCSMLNEAANDYGVLYIPLNYLIHYFGVVVAFMDPPDRAPIMPIEQVFNALGMFIFYLIVTDAKHTYGCDVETSLIPLMALVVSGACIWWIDTLSWLCTYKPF